MKTYQTEAIIIKKTKLGEADHILTLLTPEFGKLQAVAKGVRKPKSKMAGHLELLTHSRIFLAEGRNLDTITGCQTIDAFLPLKNALDLAAYGLYLTELTYHFTTEHQESGPVFGLLLKTMGRLGEAEVSPPILLRYFEVQLLKLSGYGPELQQCLICHKPLEPVSNYFSTDAGGTLCYQCGRNKPFSRSITVNAVKVLRLLKNDDLATAARLKINRELADEIEDILRRYLRYVLEREVKSTAWMDQLSDNSKLRNQNL